MESGRPYQEERKAEAVTQANGERKFIYKVMTPLETDNELYNNVDKKWLLRESSMTGMLTVAIKNKGLYRFALLENGWTMVEPKDAVTVAAALASKQITADYCAQHVQGLLQLLAEHGYLAEDMAFPNETKETKQKVYGSYVVSAQLAKNIEQQMTVTGHTSYITAASASKKLHL